MSKIAKEAKVGVNLGKQDTLSVSGQNGELCRLLASLNDRTITSTLPGTIQNNIDDEESRSIDFTMDWTMVDPDKDPTYKEIQLYIDCLYWLNMWKDFFAGHSRKGAYKEYKDEFVIVYDLILILPSENRLIHNTYIPTIRHFYKTAYTSVASRPENSLSRRNILTDVRAVLGNMSEYKQMFTEALPLSYRPKNEILYDHIMTSFHQWRERITLPLSAIRRREENGRRQ
jgi:hypothetical protein